MIGQVVIEPVIDLVDSADSAGLVTTQPAGLFDKNPEAYLSKVVCVLHINGWVVVYCIFIALK